MQKNLRASARLIVLSAVLPACLALPAAAADAPPAGKDAEAKAAAAKDPAYYWDPTAFEQQNKPGKYTVVCPGLPATVWNAVAPSLKAQPTPGKLMYRIGADAEGKPQVPHPKEAVGYTICAPKNIAPGEALGVFVYIPPNQAAPEGQMGHPFEAFADTNRLVTVALNRAGNPDAVPWRIACAVNAVQVARRRYSVDPGRVYITGVSGGGRATSYAMLRYPDIFKGAAPIVGCLPPEVWTQSANVPGSCVQQFKQATRLVILEGEKDFNRNESKGIYEALRKSMRYAAYIEQPGLGHAVPNMTYLKQAMAHLDGPCIAGSAARFAKLKPQLADHKKDGQNLADLNKLACAMNSDTWGLEAKTVWDGLAFSYKEAQGALAKTVAAASSPEDFKAADKAVEEFGKTWAPVSKEDVAKLKDGLKAAKAKASKK